MKNFSADVEKGLIKVTTIKVKNYVEDCFDQYDADRIISVLTSLTTTTDEVVLDFQDIHYYTTHFFDKLLGTVLSSNNIKFTSVNMNEVGRHLYELCSNNANQYFRKVGRSNDIQGCIK